MRKRDCSTLRASCARFCRCGHEKFYHEYCACSACAATLRPTAEHRFECVSHTIITTPQKEGESE